MKAMMTCMDLSMILTPEMRELLSYKTKLLNMKMKKLDLNKRLKLRDLDLKKR